MTRRGFTIVELIITITIMGILLLLAIVNVNATQARARDDERKTDAESFSYNLETYYTSGNVDSTRYATYPSIELMSGVDPEATIQSYLPDLNFKNITAPGATTFSDSLLMASGPGQEVGTITPQPTTSQYVYQPIKRDGTLCATAAQDCVKFNIFYQRETGSDPKITKITSKNR